MPETIRWTATGNEVENILVRVPNKEALQGVRAKDGDVCLVEDTLSVWVCKLAISQTNEHIWHNEGHYYTKAPLSSEPENLWGS